MKLTWLLWSVFSIALSGNLLAQELPAGNAVGDSISDNNTTDLSGAFFDGESLWLVTNKGNNIWKAGLSTDRGGAVSIDGEKIKHWKVDRSGDYEAITKGGYASGDTLLLLDENSSGAIVEYTFDSINGRATKGRTWKLPKYMSERSGLGSEGFTWVPETDEDDNFYWLCNELPPTDKNGVVRNNSGCHARDLDMLEGLFIIAHQDSGDLYAFRLLSNAIDGERVVLYGRYGTAKGESAGLEFDTQAKQIVIWHGGKEDDIREGGDVNVLERAILSLDKRNKQPNSLKSIERRPYPVTEIGKGHNIEGIAWLPSTSDLFLTVDNKRNKPENLLQLTVK